MTHLILAGRFGRQTMVGMLTQTRRDDLALVGALLAAVRCVGEGHARGKVVLTI